MRIWKYALNVIDQQCITMPRNAKILTVQMQDDICCLWALVDETAKFTEHRNIAIYGTGNPMPDNPGTYIATFQMHGGALVFHAFEL
jgi:hypothetical protein